jgi:hypothetical protein
MPIQAFEVDDADHASTLSLGREGRTGRRWFRVNTGRVKEAATATGIPNIGDQWETVGPLSNLLVTNIGPVDVWSHKAGATDDTRGWSYVPVDYAEPSVLGSAGTMTPPIGAAINYTLYRRSLNTVTVGRGLKFDANDPSPTAMPAWSGITVEADTNGALRVALGDGMPKQVAVRTAEVHLFRPLVNPFDEDALDALADDTAVNSDTVVLPPVYPSARTRSFTKGRLLFLGYDLSFEKDLWHATLQFEIGQNHFYYWANVDENGVPEGQKVYASKRYRNAAMTGILA